ncbi:acyl-coenzyme A thioesterase THEM4-like isoform X1 [Hydra vulgaris]|uniref:Acyl-coenzyme A thioesterase THEM4 n=1 Tax=Hydra vulgaris TaxID=6087 RepID=T2MCI1_HYDVU
MIQSLCKIQVNCFKNFKYIKNICCVVTAVHKKSFACISNNDEKSETQTWPKEAVACYNKLENLVHKHNWEKYNLHNWKGESAGRHYGVCKDINIYQGSFFYSKTEKKAKAVITYGPYSEGFFGHVHGGAIATHHDEITGIVGSLLGTCVTANLNINYKSRLLIGQTTLYSGELEKVEGRKVYIKSKVTCPEEKTLYSEATAILIIINNS